jgi:uncharacterized protein (DUF1778 family)
MPRRIVTPKKKTRTSPLMVRLDTQSKRVLAQAARLRQISVSDYVRQVTVSQARREIRGAKNNVIILTPDELLAFWQALHEPPKLTAKQKQLGAMMRGEL